MTSSLADSSLENLSYRMCLVPLKIKMLGYTGYFGTRGTREGTNKNIKKIETKETQGFILYLHLQEIPLQKEEEEVKRDVEERHE